VKVIVDTGGSSSTTSGHLNELPRRADAKPSQKHTSATA
jgi:hypothetical protein